MIARSLFSNLTGMKVNVILFIFRCLAEIITLLLSWQDNLDWIYGLIDSCYGGMPMAFKRALL